MPDYTMPRVEVPDGPVTSEHDPWSALARRAATDGRVDEDAAALTAALLAAREPTVEEIDAQLVELIRRRTEYARRDQLARRAGGLPARRLADENAMVQRFSAHLGGRGIEIAAAVIALSQPKRPG